MAVRSRALAVEEKMTVKAEAGSSGTTPPAGRILRALALPPDQLTAAAGRSFAREHTWTRSRGLLRFGRLVFGLRCCLDCDTLPEQSQIRTIKVTIS